jgi:hypothetical protein
MEANVVIGMLLGIVINLIAIIGPLLLLIGIDAWLQSRDFVLSRWSYGLPICWAIVAGWVIYPCTLRDNCL